MLKFEYVLTEGISQLSYLLGDDSTGTAAVIDPRPDCEIYLQLAQQHGLAITHIFETHIHADFLSGARELAARCRGARICASEEGGAEYGFDHEAVHDGDTFTFGSLKLTVRHTPGHTPEHVAYEAAEKAHPQHPWGVFTGDSLFVNSAGRPDLLGEEESKELASKLYDTLYNYYGSLSDDTLLYPCHGAGSACGADIGDRLQSTMGYERRFNPFLQYQGKRQDFETFVLEGAPPAPTHYPRLKKVNAKGPEVLGNLPAAEALPPDAFQEQTEAGGAVLVDTRPMMAFGGGHIAHAINIGSRPEFSVYAGWMLDPDKPILLVLEDDAKLGEILRMFWRTGFTRFAGYLAGGMLAWNKKGLPLEHIGQMTVHDVAESVENLQILDVRGPDELKSGHVPNAVHHFVGDMREDTPDLDKSKPVVTYCATGYRASIAASLLQSRGFEDVRNMPGSWTAWKSAKLPIEGEQ